MAAPLEPPPGDFSVQRIQMESDFQVRAITEVNSSPSFFLDIFQGPLFLSQLLLFQPGTLD